MDAIEKMVHECYWTYDLNCARTTLRCLSALFSAPVEEQVYQAAVGLHGAGGCRAQCGLVEGALLFIGLYAVQREKGEPVAVAACYKFAERFEQRFGSLRCRELRPGGFAPGDPPHACEKLTVEAIRFARDFVQDALG